MFGSKLEKIEKAAAKGKVAELIKFTNDKDSSVALGAIAALGKVKEDDSFNALVTLLSSTDAAYRKAAATSIGDIGNGHGKAFLLHAAQIEKDPEVKKAMENACGKLRDY